MDDGKYRGFVTLEDISEDAIDVTVDKDNPENFIWECTKPTPSMVQAQLKKALN